MRSKCQAIKIRRGWAGPRPNAVKFTRYHGKCREPVPYRMDGKVYAWGYTINATVSRYVRYPHATRSGAVLHTEDELMVWLIAHEAAHYLLATGQVPGEDTEPECDAFADRLLGEYRPPRPTGASSA